MAKFPSKLIDTFFHTNIAKCDNQIVYNIFKWLWITSKCLWKFHKAISGLTKTFFVFYLNKKKINKKIVATVNLKLIFIVYNFCGLIIYFYQALEQ